MPRLVALAIARPKSTIFAWLLLSALLLPSVARLRPDVDPRHVLASSDARLADDRRMRELFKLYDFVAVAVVTDSGAFRPDTLDRFFHASREIKQVPGVMPLDVFSPENVEDIQQAAGDIATTPVSIVKLQREEIHDQADADAILARIRANPVLKGKLASDDGKVLTIFVAYDPSGNGWTVASEVERICRKYAAPDERVYVTGLPVEARARAAEIARSLLFLLPASLLLSWLIAFAVLGRPDTALVAVTSAILSCLWGLAAIAGTSHGLQPLSSLTALILAPLAMLGPVHFLLRSRTAPGGPWIRPLVAAGILPAAASLWLLALPVPELRAAGACLAAGSLVSTLLTFTFVPACGALLPARDPGPARMTAGVARLAALAPSFPRAVRLGLAAATIVLGLGILRLRAGDDATRWLAPRVAARQAEDRFDGQTSGVQFDYLTLEGTEEDGVKEPAVLRYIEDLQRELERSPIVRATTALPDVVKKIRYELFNDPAKNVLPARKDESAQMLFVYEISGGNPDKLFHLVTPDYSKVAIWIQMNSQDQAAVREVTARFDRFVAAHPLPPGLVAHWTGVPYLSAASEAGAWRAAARWGWALAAAASLIAWMAALRSWRAASAAALAAAIAIVIVYGVLGWSGIRCGLFAALVFPLVAWIGAGQALRGRGAPESLLALGVLPMFFSGLAAGCTLAAVVIGSAVLAMAVTASMPTRGEAAVPGDGG